MANEKYNKKIERFYLGNFELLDRLRLLDKKKQEIIRLNEQYGDLEEPIVITISGTPRAGKTTCIDNLFEFLKKSNLKTKCLEEPAGLVYQTLKNKEEKKELLKHRVSFVNRQFQIGSEYIDNNLTSNDIILCDRGAIDPFFWMDMYYHMGLVSIEEYKTFLEKIKILNKYNNKFYVLYTETFTSMCRDYLSSLSIEPRTTMNEDNVGRFNESIKRMMPVIDKEIGNTKLIDTTKCDKMEPSIMIANEVLDDVKKMYLRRG